MAWFNRPADVEVSAATYQFFTGRVPEAGGMEYLIESPANQSDLSDPYYAQFNRENRYINFANNLGSFGAGKPAFEATYGSLSYEDTIRTAYKTIIGTEPTAGEFQFFLNARSYYEAVALERVVSSGVPLAQATKVVAVGSILNEAIKVNNGIYADRIKLLVNDVADDGASSLLGKNLIDSTETVVKNIEGTDAGERLEGTLEADHIRGGGGHDVIFGDGFAPGIAGQGRSPDRYISGDDKIWGDDGNDWISGGHGADWLWGGNGADRFVIGSHIPINPTYITPAMYVLDTGVGDKARDVIFDFVQGEDKIDLSQLLSLGYRHLNINDAYEFIGAREFTGVRPQVRYEFEGNRTIIQLDGANYHDRGVDGLVDAEIELHARIHLRDTDPLL